MIARALIAFGIVVGGFFAYVLTRPDTYSYERSIIINGPPAQVYDLIDDFDSWGKWSPVDKLDPNMEKSFSDQATGVGAFYSWKGAPQVGTGRTTVTQATPNQDITWETRIEQPTPGGYKSAMTLTPKAAGKVTKVTWRIFGNNSFSAKLMGVVMDLEGSSNGMLDAGLKALKQAVEKAPKNAGK